MDMHVFRNVNVLLSEGGTSSAPDCLSARPEQTQGNWCDGHIYTEILQIRFHLPPAPSLQGQTCYLSIARCAQGVSTHRQWVWSCSRGHLPARVTEESTHFPHICETPFALHNKCTRHIQPLWAACLLISPKTHDANVSLHYGGLLIPGLSRRMWVSLYRHSKYCDE